MTNKEAIAVFKGFKFLPKEQKAVALAIKALEELEETERPQGKWIRTGSLGNGNAQYECSNCRHGDEQAESQEVPYCWYCGAKMMKGDKE